MSTTEGSKPQDDQPPDTHESNIEEPVVAQSLEEPLAEQDTSAPDDNDEEYYAQFEQPDDSTEEFCLSDLENDEIYLSYRLTRKQYDQVDQLEQTPYHRAKRSHKKMNAQCQIKTKHAKSVKFNSHNKQLYMHHRLFKRAQLDPPSSNYLPSPAARSVELARSLAREEQKQAAIAARVRPPSIRPPAPPQFREFTLNEQNRSHTTAFDDAMLAFLIDMQNRDLSPEDYEMLLRLDERVQRKTVDKNVLDTLPTVTVDETHLNDRCAICMESYALGQKLKSLPCKHLFHVACIETYLKEFSVQCPLDNLPLT